MMNILQKNNEVFIETDRLILRPWKLEDASNLYELIKDPDIGPACGFLPHENPEKVPRSVPDPGICRRLLCPRYRLQHQPKG